MLGWLSEHWGTVVAIGSAILNLLGGTGLVKPVVDLRKRDPEPFDLRRDN